MISLRVCLTLVIYFLISSRRGIRFDSTCHLHPIGVSFDRLGWSCSHGAFEKAHPLIEQAWFGSRRKPRSAYRPIGIEKLFLAKLVECPVGAFLLTARVTYTLSGFRLTAWVGPVRTGLSRKLALWSNRLGSSPVGSLGQPSSLSANRHWKLFLAKLL